MTNYQITVGEDVYTTEADEAPVPPELGGEWLLEDGQTIDLDMGPDGPGYVEVKDLDDDDEETHIPADCQQPYGFKIECVCGGKSYTFYSPGPNSPPAPNPSPARWVKMDFFTVKKLSANGKKWEFSKSKTTIFLNPAQMSAWLVTPLPKPSGCP